MKKLLVIEDDQFLLHVYRSKFDDAGYEVLILEESGNVLDEAKKFKPDVIITDIVMPIKNGFEVVKELKGDNQTKNIPIIVLTNLSQEEDKKKLEKLGVDKFMVKTDFTFKEVLEVVESILK